MKDVNITELRQKLPAYLEKVRKGKRIRITSRGRVIAELSPPTVTVDEADAARALLKGSIRRYECPFEAAIPSAEWDVHR